MGYKAVNTYISTRVMQVLLDICVLHGLTSLGLQASFAMTSCCTFSAPFV